MLFEMDRMTAQECYKVLSASIVPRPIAWITSVSADGIRNAAPYSFFNMMGNAPPTVAIGAECDPLCDDAAAYAERVRAAGGEAIAWVEPGLVHGYLRARHSVARARKSFARIVAAVRMLGLGHWDEVSL